MHLYAEMSECEELLTSACTYAFFCTQLAYSTINRNETDLAFIPVPSYASSFTGTDDGYRSVSLPSLFRFGNSLYPTAYVNDRKEITYVHAK